MATSTEINRAERIAALMEAARVERAQTLRHMLQRLLRGMRLDRKDVVWPVPVRPAAGDCG
jgi:hypothetical protein